MNAEEVSPCHNDQPRRGWGLPPWPETGGFYLGIDTRSDARSIARVTDLVRTGLSTRRVRSGRLC